MKNRISFHDVENLSASLDGQLSRAEVARLRIRLETNPLLAASLEHLRQARRLIRNTPQRRVPRNFILTPAMAGIKPPVPRVVPFFSWASAVAALLFVCSLGTTYIGNFARGAAAPQMAAPSSYGVGGGPSDQTLPTEAPAVEGILPALTPTPEILLMQEPASLPATEERAVESQDSSSVKTSHWVNPWLLIWPGITIFLIGMALLVRWIGILTFRHKIAQKNK